MSGPEDGGPRTVTFDAPSVSDGIMQATRGRKARLQALGREAVTSLYMLVRNARLYDAGNDVFTEPLLSLRENINTVIAIDGKFDFAAAGTLVTLNGVPVLVAYNSLEYLRELTTDLKDHDIGGLQAKRAVHIDELRAFLRAYMDNRDMTSTRLDGLIHIDVLRYRTIVEQLNERNELEIDQNRSIDRRRYAFLVYARAITYMKRFVDAIAAGSDAPPSMLPAMRLVRDLVDIVYEHRREAVDETTARTYFLGLSATKNSEDYLAYHSVNTCLMSLVVGHELGLDRDQLFDLGRAALFHDVGAAGADRRIMSKPGQLTSQERHVVAQSPLLAARVMLKVRPLDLGALRCVLAAAEVKHPYFRVKVDPATGRARWHLQVLGLHSRVIRICSTYDALTSERPFRAAFPPETALSVMTSQMKHEFDPLLLETFVKVLARLQVSRASAFSLA